MKEKYKYKVSIIVPIYNVGKYLNKCITSLINQTYKNIEIILVNDGSSDNSLDIINYFNSKDDRIIVINKKNNGVSSARNSGIKKATGDFICFVDGDDYVMDNYVEYLLDLVIKNDALIGLTQTLYTDYDLKNIKKDYIKILSSEDTIQSILCYKIPIGVYSKIFSSKLFKNNLKFNEELCMGEGFNFNISAFKLSDKIVIGNKKIYFYRKNNFDSVTSKFNAYKFENGLYALELIKKNINIKNKKLKNAWKFANWRTHTDVYDAIALSGDKKNNKKLYNKCKKVIKKDFFISFFVPISIKQRLRSIIMFIYPNFIPLLMSCRKKVFLNQNN